jgi:hypothetical protein
MNHHRFAKLYAAHLLTMSRLGFALDTAERGDMICFPREE